MTWYYPTVDGDLVPFEEGELAEMVRSGQIAAPTLIWYEGLEDWVGCSELRPDLFAGAGDSLVAASGNHPEGHVDSDPKVLICRSCGAENVEGQRICWICHRIFTSRRSPHVPGPSILVEAPPTISPVLPLIPPAVLKKPERNGVPVALLIGIGIPIVVVGVWNISPFYGFMVALALFPALIPCLILGCVQAGSRRSRPPGLGSAGVGVAEPNAASGVDDGTRAVVTATAVAGASASVVVVVTLGALAIVVAVVVVILILEFLDLLGGIFGA